MDRINLRITAKQTFHYYWQELRHQKPMFISAFILIPVALFLNNFATAWIMSQVINRLTTEQIPYDQVWQIFGPWVFAYIAIILIGELLLWRVALFLVWKLESRVVYGLNRRSFDTLAHQSLDFHNNRFGGSLVSQVNKFSNSYVIMSNMVAFNLLPLVFSFIFTFAILGPVLPIFAVSLGFMALTFITIATLSFRPIRTLNAKEAESQTKLSGQLADSITNIMAVKSHGSERLEEKRYDELNRSSHQASLNVITAIMRRDIGFGAVIAAISGLAFLFLVGGQYWFGVPIGTLILAMTYSGQILGQLWGFNNILRSTSRALGDAQEMTRVMDTSRSVDDVLRAKTMKVSKAVIGFNGVTFRHSDAGEAERPLFKDFSLTVGSGEQIGLVGQSGSGKTTLLKLLLRFANVNQGTITIDGQDIAKASQRSLRRSIAYVPQEPLLFHRTLKDNIRYGNPKATDKEVETAARKANALEFIKKLPDGFDTTVGERGVKLSGGQRQRIAIARAILKDAPILILDEATSALDSESESLIQEALGKLMKDRTSIVIAHRLSTIAKLDRVIVLKDGSIVEEGSHADLLTKNGAYAKLWKHQSGGMLEQS